jgi:hypothetical protein
VALLSFYFYTFSHRPNTSYLLFLSILLHNVQSLCCFTLLDDKTIFMGGLFWPLYIALCKEKRRNTVTDDFWFLFFSWIYSDLSLESFLPVIRNEKITLLEIALWAPVNSLLKPLQSDFSPGFLIIFFSSFFFHPLLVACTSTEWLYRSNVSRKDHNMGIYDVTQMISESLEISLKLLQAREKKCIPRISETILHIDQFWSSLLMTDVTVKVLCL